MLHLAFSPGSSWRNCRVDFAGGCHFVSCSEVQRPLCCDCCFSRMVLHWCSWLKLNNGAGAQSANYRIHQNTISISIYVMYINVSCYRTSCHFAFLYVLSIFVVSIPRIRKPGVEMAEHEQGASGCISCKHSNSEYLKMLLLLIYYCRRNTCGFLWHPVTKAQHSKSWSSWCICVLQSIMQCLSVVPLRSLKIF